MPSTLHLISHTHWDREWYLPFQAFRLRLVRLIDHVLDLLEQDPDTVHFSLDGQTIVIDDYLAIRPDAGPRLRAQVESGRLGIGPWFQLNDEHLVSGEATVRSLLAGTRAAMRLGRCLRVGYLPDQFGNVSQMPQVFRGFGIDNAIMGRGRHLEGDRKAEFRWVSPDGSWVRASLMAWWYNNAQYLPDDPEAASAFLEGVRQMMAPHCILGDLLLMNGVDHLEAQPFAGRIAREVDAAWVSEGLGRRVRQSSLEEYVARLRELDPAELETVAGELREDRGGSCLAGTLSARLYLKQANHKSQTLLESIAEPLAVMARLRGRAYPIEELGYAWRLLMQNHPHDSICGCSVDQVHREMEVRFEQVCLLADELNEEALDTVANRDRGLGASAEYGALHVVNTLAWERSGLAEAVVSIPLGPPSRSAPSRDWSVPVAFDLVDEVGRSIPFEVLSVEDVLTSVISPRELPLDQHVRRFRVLLRIDAVPGLGVSVYRLVAADQWPKVAAAAFPEMPEGVTLVLEDNGDVGDEYLHRPPAADALRVLEIPLSGLDCEVGALRRTWRGGFDWSLPMRSEGVAERSPIDVVCPVSVEIVQQLGVRRIECTIGIENSAADHRVRARVRAPWCAAETFVTEAQFDVIVRPVTPQYVETGASRFVPQRLWSAVSEPEGGDGRTLAVLNAGLPEVEPSIEGAASLAVTLLRCVGQLSGRGDGPGILTPGAQCPGHRTALIGWVLGEGSWEQLAPWRDAVEMSVPLLAVQGPVASGAGALTVSTPTLVITAVKRAEDRDTVIVRGANYGDSALVGASVTLAGGRRYRATNLNEDADLPWTDGCTATVCARPREIITLEFEPGCASGDDVR